MELITIEKEKINEVVTIDGVEFLIVSKEQLKTLLQQNVDLKGDVKELKECTFDVLRLMGLFDEETKTIKKDNNGKKINYVMTIIKSLTKTGSLLAQSQISKSAEEELLEKFAFIKTNCAKRE